MKSKTCLAMVVWLALAGMALGDNYRLASNPELPPLPFNSKPWCDVITDDGTNWWVQDAPLTDRQVLGRASRMMMEESTTPPEIVDQPADASVPMGSNVTFSVTASGTDPLHYQWGIYDPLLGGYGTTIANATNADLTLSNVGPGDSAGYLVIVTNAYGSVTSAPAYLDVQVPDMSWVGTWIVGLPLLDAYGNVSYAEPALWTITCTNKGNSEYVHTKLNWYAPTKVCPGDMVYVLWPYSVCTNPPGSNCFFVLQQGTNGSGGCWTNGFLAKMDNANHDQGNWGAWKVPDWPTNFPNVYLQTNCLWWCYMAIPCCTNCLNRIFTNGVPIPTNGVQTNFLADYLIPCGDILDFGASWGMTPADGAPPGTELPHRSILIDIPTRRDCVNWDPSHYGTGAPDPFNKDTVQGSKCRGYFNLGTYTGPLGGSCDMNETIIGWCLGQYPKMVNPLKLSDGTPQDSTNCVEVATNTVLTMSWMVHGLPGANYILEGSTNLSQWTMEGNTNFTTDANGIAQPIYWSTNLSDFQEPRKYYRVRQQ